jgi:hypothetical protein
LKFLGRIFAFLVLTSFNIIMNGIEVIPYRRIFLQKLLKRHGSTLYKVGKLDGMTGSHINTGGMITHVHLGTRLGSSNVYLISLETSELLVDSSNDPCSCADSSGFKEEAPAEQEISDGAGQEGNGESRCNQLPGNGSDNGSNECSKKTSVEKFLHTSIYSKDILGTIVCDRDRSYASNEEHTGYDTELTSHHESREVVTFSRVQQVTCPQGPYGISTFGSRDLGDGEESNLHTLEHTNDGHEDEEDNDCEPCRYSLPHGGLVIEESFQGNCETEA